MSVGASQQNRLAWLVVLLLFTGSVLNYVDRVVLHHGVHGGEAVRSFCDRPTMDLYG